jgi:acyl-CoA oxidase
MNFGWKHLVESAAARLRAHMAKGNPFDAANAVGDHMVALATAYSERSVAEIFWKAVESERSAEIKAELARQCALYALDCIHRDSGWFQEQGYIAGAKAQAIRSEITDLCGEIRPQATNLVNAFGISDELLQSHIGRMHRAPGA